MRDLTEEELKLVPDWATHYFFYYNGDICFESEDRLCEYSVSKGCITIDAPWKHTVRQACEPIPKKPFDITKHEFSDRDIAMATLANNYLCIHLDGKAPYVVHSKQDAIAIAKSLGVTGEDLK